MAEVGRVQVQGQCWHLRKSYLNREEVAVLAIEQACRVTEISGEANSKGLRLC